MNVRVWTNRWRQSGAALRNPVRTDPVSRCRHAGKPQTATATVRASGEQEERAAQYITTHATGLFLFVKYPIRLARRPVKP